jgi:ketosteroid isomerase-like protein
MTDNVSRVESFYADITKLFSAFDPEIEWHEMPGIAYGGVYHGPDEVMANVYQRIGSEWDDFSATPHTVMAADPDCVVALGHYAGVCKATGKRLESCDFAHVYYLRDGNIVKFRQYVDSAVFNAAMT